MRRNTSLVVLACALPPYAVHGAPRVAVPMQCRFVAMAGGTTHSLVLDTDGNVWAMGSGYATGIGDLLGHSLPAPLPALSQVTAIASGSDHCLARKSDGTVWGWGVNEFGQVGNGESGRFNRVLVPAQVVGLPPAVAVGCGAYHSLAVADDLSAWAWGENSFGMLGDNTTVDSPVPVACNGLSGTSAVAGGRYHSMALVGDRIWSWGTNLSGMMGDAAPDSGSLVPLQSPTLASVTARAAGELHSLGLVGGEVWSWGDETWGQLGNGVSGTGQFTKIPVRAQGLTGVTAISSRWHTSLALAGGVVWAWGLNNYGELGNGSGGLGQFSAVPVQASNLTNVVAIGSGSSHSLAMTDDGTVWAWGWNSTGALGDGTGRFGAFSTVPVRVLFDGIPGDQGNVLLAVRRTGDVELSWPADPFKIQDASAWQVYADSDLARLGTTPLATNTIDRAYTDAGAVGRPGILYYRLKGLSRCTLTAGQ